MRAYTSRSCVNSTRLDLLRTLVLAPLLQIGPMARDVWHTGSQITELVGIPAATSQHLLAAIEHRQVA